MIPEQVKSSVRYACIRRAAPRFQRACLRRAYGSDRARFEWTGYQSRRFMVEGALAGHRIIKKARAIAKNLQSSAELESFIRTCCPEFTPTA